MERRPKVIRTVWWRRAGLLQAAAAGLVAALLSGCETVRYYSQAAQGQWQLLHQRKPIAELLADPTTAPELKRKLELIQDAREFAASKLALDVGDAYSTYSDLKRPYVVWNMVATEEFSTTPIEFCFPIAGCLQYKGYFEEAMARQQAAALRDQGKDVFVGGVAAYSSLGWFADPVLNTFINRDDTWLVALIFHETTHRTLYFPGDSRFNESLATAVEQAGLRHWMQLRGEPAQWDRYQQSTQRQAEFIALVSSFKKELDAYYQTSKDLDITTRRAEKNARFAELKQRYALQKQQWNHYSGYDNWFNDNLSNAKLSAVATYHDLTPLFSQLLEKLNYDYKLFFETLRAFEKLPPDQRVTQLHQLLR